MERSPRSSVPKGWKPCFMSYVSFRKCLTFVANSCRVVSSSCFLLLFRAVVTMFFLFISCSRAMQNAVLNVNKSLLNCLIDSWVWVAQRASNPCLYFSRDEILNTHEFHLSGIVAQSVEQLWSNPEVVSPITTLVSFSLSFCCGHSFP